MNAIILDDTHRKCPYCYAEFARKDGDSDKVWQRRIYCGGACSSKGVQLDRRQRMAAKRRVIRGDV